MLTIIVSATPNEEISVSDSITLENEKYVENVYTFEELNEISKKTESIDNKYTLSSSEEDLINYYKDNPLKVGVCDQNQFFTQIDGQYLGVDYIFIEKFAETFGINVTYVIKPYDELESLLKSGEIDILLSNYNDTKSLNNIDFSKPFFYQSPVIYTKDIPKNNIEMIDLNNTKIGKLSHSDYFNKKQIEYLKNRGVNVTIVEYETEKEMLDAMLNDEVSHLACKTSPFLLSNGLYKSTFLGDNIGSLHYIAFSPETNPRKLSGILDSFINEELEKELYKYDSQLNLSLYKNGYFFTEEEKAYVKTNPSLKVSTLTNTYYPFIYLDDNKDLIGAEIYIFDRLSKLLNINYDIDLGDIEFYEETVQSLKNDNHDVVLGLYPSTYTGSYFDSTKPLISSNYILMGHKNSIDNVADVVDSSIGLLKNEIISEYMINSFPLNDFIIFETEEEAVTALINKEIDYLPVNEEYYRYLIYLNGEDSLHNCYKFDLKYNNVFSFIKDDDSAILASIYTKGFDFIDKTQIINSSESIYKNAIYGAIKMSHIKKYVPLVLLAFMLILFFLLHNNFKIRQNRNKVLELTEKYNDILLSTGATFWYFDIENDELVITQDLIELVGLVPPCYEVRDDKIVLVFNELLPFYFLDEGVMNSIIAIFYQILSLEESKAEFDFDIKKGMQDNNIIRLKVTFRYDNISEKKSIYGLVQNVTADHLYRNKLLNMALIDTLTGADNRNALLEQLSNNYRGKIICFMDLDDFKAVNDTYGHEHGDFVLKNVVARVDRIDGIEKIYRLGGDEFVLIQNELNMDAIYEVQKSINEVMTYKDCSYQVSSCIGILPTDLYSGKTLEECLNVSDMLMYYAKNQGKNAVELYNPKKDYSDFTNSKENKK